MKRLSLLLCALLALATTARAADTSLPILGAQATSAHNVHLTWAPGTQPTGVVLTGFKVYRAPCTGAISAGVCPTASEGTFAVLATISSATTLAYDDGTVVASTAYSYYVTAVATGSSPPESVASNHVGALVPNPQPNPPVLLSITSVSLNRNGANAQLSAAWIDAPSSATTWTLKAGTTAIATGKLTAVSGNYAIGWSGKISPNTSGLIFTVCDQVGTCLNRPL